MVVLDSQVRRTRIASGIAAAFLTAVVGLTIGASTQSLSAPALRAAYLYNFAQFVEWPAGAMPADASLVLCVVDDGAVADVLERTTRGRTVEGHDLVVRRLKAGALLPACHVLYVAGSDLKRSLALVSPVKGLVLTVSDAPGFAKAGGMVELFLEDGRMRFAVNVDALQRARVKLSSRVLTLAKIVRDDKAQ